MAYLIAHSASTNLSRISYKTNDYCTDYL